MALAENLRWDEESSVHRTRQPALAIVREQVLAHWDGSELQLPEWSEADVGRPTSESKHSIEIIEVLSAVAYLLAACIFFAFAVLSVLYSNGAWFFALVICMLGCLFYGIGRVIEMRWRANNA
jgi:hypothetical protein